MKCILDPCTGSQSLREPLLYPPTMYNNWYLLQIPVHVLLYYTYQLLHVTYGALGILVQIFLHDFQSSTLLSLLKIMILKDTVPWYMCFKAL